MRSMHGSKTVEGLVRKLGTARPPELRRGILSTLTRLYHREADSRGTWWGVRADSTGPYYDRAEWEMSKRIGAVLTTAARDGDPDAGAFVRAEPGRHKVALAGLPGVGVAAKIEPENPLVLPKADPKNPRPGGTQHGAPRCSRRSRASCHTTADGQTPKGPHLVEIGKRSKADEL
ncbi:MAG TPA: hypothetical protein VH092_25290, partial [Urbifossiella sp.]|nr:hypothetical protein [Urbifossiella sp.]